MAELEVRNPDQADETRPFVDKGRVEIVKLAGGTVGRGTFEPGWRWSEHVKPIAGTESCQAPHMGYCISGRMVVRIDGAGPRRRSARATSSSSPRVTTPGSWAMSLRPGQLHRHQGDLRQEGLRASRYPPSRRGGASGQPFGQHESHSEGGGTVKE